MPPYYTKNRGILTQNKIAKDVFSGELYGFIQVDMECPQGDYWPEQGVKPNTSLSPTMFYSESPPIFANTNVDFSEVGNTMQEHIVKMNLSTKPQRYLIGALQCEKLLLSTTYVQYLMSIGVRLLKCHLIIEFTGKRCFTAFKEDIVQSRIEAMMGGPNLKIIGATKKLIANSAYGSFLIQKSKFNSISYANKPSAVKCMINDGAFMDSSKLGHDLYEVKMKKKCISYNVPSVLGFQILNQAKVELLKVYYDFLLKYYKYDHFYILCSDTDSFYVAYSSRLIDNMITSSKMLSEFKNRMYNNCHDRDVGLDSSCFLPRECCDRHRLIDQYTVGSLKVESEGRELIGLSSKTYLLVDDKQQPVKISCKGAMKANLESPFKLFKNVLETGQVGSVENLGIRFMNNKMWTYSQQRNCFSFVYKKRQILSDLTSSIPLKTIAYNLPNKNAVYIYGKEHPLSNHYAQSIIYEENVFLSAHHWFCYEKLMCNGYVDRACKLLLTPRYYIFMRDITCCSEWYDNEKQIMLKILQNKVDNDEVVKLSLLEINLDNAVYCDEYDSIYSCGHPYKMASVLHSENMLV